MKSILRRILGCITAAMLMCALPVLAFATEGDGNNTTNPYSITVVNKNSTSIIGATCSVYKVMDIEVTDTDTSGGSARFYNYAFTELFEDFSYGEGESALSGEDLINALNKHDSTIDTPILAKNLADHVSDKTDQAKSKPIAKVGDIEQATISDLTPGYYLVTITTNTDGSIIDVSLPILVVLTEENPHQTVYAKLDTPHISKVIVGEDGKEMQATSVEVGSTVRFKITTFVPTMGENYKDTGYSFKITDMYSSGIVPNMDTLSVLIDNKPASKFTDEDSTGLYVVAPKEGENSFSIEFNSLNFYNGYADKAGALIEIAYDATITEDIIEANNQQATNTVNLTYPNVPENPPSDEVTVFSFAIDVWKYSPSQDEPQIDAIKEKGFRLSGAKFVLYKMTGDTKSYYKYENDAVSWVGENQNPTELETNGDGHLDPCFKGLAAGTYYLVETQAPAGGYNKLEQPIEINLTTSEGQDYGITHKQPVANSKGIVLPGTGGVGTIIFYCVGGALVLGALVVLIARRRMASRDK